MENNINRINSTMRTIFIVMKGIVLYDFVFKRWLLDEEYTIQWLTNRVLNCYFIDGAFCYDQRITSREFRIRYEKRLSKYIADSRAIEMRKHQEAIAC